MGIEMDINGFKRDLRRATERAANDGLRQSAQELQRELNAVSNSHGGRPIDEVKPALRAASKRIGMQLSEEELTEFATAISEGVPITVKAQRVRL